MMVKFPSFVNVFNYQISKAEVQIEYGVSSKRII